MKYKGMDLHLPDKPKRNKNVLATAAVSSRQTDSVQLLRKIELYQFTQSPYTDADLSKMEAAVRRNLAVRTALSVREFFTFGGRSSLVIELNESDKLNKDETEIQEEVKKLTESNLDILKEIDDEDNSIGLVQNIPTLAWQCWQYGRGVMIKFFRDEANTQIAKLMPINSRRMGEVILDRSNNMSFEGVWVDGQPLDRESMLYALYGNRQISPHTEHYGYSAIEPIVHIAESHNIATEEDIKEIFKSAWLKSILFVINTAGMTSTKASTYISTMIDAIDPGKYIGVNNDVKEVVPLDLDPKYDGIVAMVDSLESKIFKSLQVPQFLVQSESIANYATASAAATLFLDGPCAHDQTWMSETLWEQRYKQALRERLNLKVDADGKEPRLPFKIKRTWQKPKVEEFLAMAQAVVALKNAGIWDVQQANKQLGSEEATKRVLEEQKKQESKMDAQLEEAGQQNPQQKPNQPTKAAV